jgi:hypothetical protein
MATPDAKFVISAQDRASATLKKVGAEFGALSSSARLATTLLTSFGGALSLGAAAAALRSVANLQDQMGKMAQQTGIGVEALSALDYAAKLSDVSTEELGAGISRLTAKMGDVAQGSKQSVAIFKALGVSVLGAGGQMRPTEEVLGDIADRFSEFADGPEKTAFAIEIFGRAGAKLIPLLNQGRDGLQEMREEAERLGIVIDSKTAKAAEDFNDNLTRLSATTRGVLMDAFTPLIASLGEIAARFLDARREGLAFGESLDVALAIKGFGTLEEKIASVREKLEGKRSGRWTGLFSNQSEAELTAELNKLLAIQRRVESRATAQHPAGFRSSLFGPREATGATPRFPTNPTGGKTPAEQLADEVAQLQKRAAALGENKIVEEAIWEVTKGRFKTLSDGEKQRLIDAAKALQAATDAEEIERNRVKTIGEQHVAEMRLLEASQKVNASVDAELALERQYQGLLDDTAQSEADRFIRIVDYIEKQRELGRISAATAAEMKKLATGVPEKLSEADEWAREAARNIQDALGQNLYDILDGKFDSIGRSFGNMLKRMAAEAMAANLSKMLFGDYAKDGKISGWLGDGLGWLASRFGGGGLTMRASGGPVSARTPYMVGEKGPEVFMPLASGNIVPNNQLGGVTVAPTITINGEMSRSQEARLAVMMRNVALATMADSRRRAMA